MKRDRFTCTYCGAPGSDVELEVDHIVPVSKGGSHHLSNLTTACRACNQGKGADGSVVPPKASIRTAKHPLVGMCLHTFDEDGVIHYQGTIVGVDGDVVLVQLYEWLMGEPTVIAPWDKTRIYAASTRLYADHDTMAFEYKKYCSRRCQMGDPLYQNFRWDS